MPPYESVFQVIESGRGGKNLEKLLHYLRALLIHIIGFHVTFNKT